MSESDYLHGIRVVKGKGEVRVVLTPNQAVVGVVGTAPHAADSLPAELPVAFQKKEEALAAICSDVTKQDKGTLFDSVRAIFLQGTRTVVVVRAKSESTEDIKAAIDKFLDAESLTNHKPKILVAPGHTGNIPKLSEGPKPAVPPALEQEDAAEPIAREMKPTIPLRIKKNA